MTLKSIKKYLDQNLTNLSNKIKQLQWNIYLLDKVRDNIWCALDELPEVEDVDQLATWWQTLNKCINIDICTLTNYEVIKLYNKIQNKLHNYWMVND